MAVDLVVVVVTIIKVNGHTRVDTEDVEHVEDVKVQINVCDLTTIKTHPMELIGWRISSMNQGFMPSFRQIKRPDYMNYEKTEAAPRPLQPKRYPELNRGY